RLACVKPVASVHPEPGSNSTLYISFFFFTFDTPPGQRPASYSRHDNRLLYIRRPLLLACVIISKNFLLHQGQPLKSGCKSTHFRTNHQTFSRKSFK
ncbi:hypothetical protein, partial [Marseilla massiliensis]|uniref:hypothetical protein n=1 Tax=Marseilla massiliensis TaxID=1841864 RepID=UPI00196140DA